jgi:hypothetical protein
MPKPSKSSRLTAEEKLLEKQRADILRKQVELETRLRKLPAVLEAQEEMQRERTKRRAMAAGPAISSGAGRTLTRRSQKRGGGRRTPRREASAARTKTLILILILAVIVFLVWNAIPGQ